MILNMQVVAIDWDIHGRACALRKDPGLHRQIALRVSDEEAERLEALSARFPIVSRHAIARAALRLGLALLEEDPSRLLEPAAPSRKRRK